MKCLSLIWKTCPGHCPFHTQVSVEKVPHARRAREGLPVSCSASTLFFETGYSRNPGCEAGSPGAGPHLSSGIPCVTVTLANFVTSVLGSGSHICPVSTAPRGPSPQPTPQWWHLKSSAGSKAKEIPTVHRGESMCGSETLIPKLGPSPLWGSWAALAS